MFDDATVCNQIESQHLHCRTISSPSKLYHLPSPDTPAMVPTLAPEQDDPNYLRGGALPTGPVMVVRVKIATQKRAILEWP